MPFTIIHDLDQLTEAQKQTYAASAAEHFGLDPALNPFDFIWMIQESGYRKLCLYARRGTTDILRDKNKISIISLTQHDGPGYVSFTAVGEIPSGRREIAVGSHSIEGLRGEALAAAIMTAQTRALRRLTLQFVGVGILDVSEVNAPVENEQKPVTPISLTPAPIVPISHEAGKDITAKDTTLTPLQEFQKQPDHDMQKCVESNVPCGNIVHDLGKFTVVDINSPSVPRTQEQFEADQAKLRQDAIDKANAETTSAEPVKKTRKPRKPKVDLGSSEPVSATPILTPAVVEKPEPAQSVSVVQAAIGVPALAATVPVAPPPVPTKPRLTPEQVKPFRQRHFKLVSDLEKPVGDGGGGFEPREGMGNPDKMRAFATMMFPDITNMNELTVEQWEKFLSLLETKFKTEGAVATVKYIEDAIGI